MSSEVRQSARSRVDPAAFPTEFAANDQSSEVVSIEGSNPDNLAGGSASRTPFRRIVPISIR
jgi:hypothetical protein